MKDNARAQTCKIALESGANVEAAVMYREITLAGFELSASSCVVGMVAALCKI